MISLHFITSDEGQLSFRNAIRIQSIIGSGFLLLRNEDSYNIPSSEKEKESIEVIIQ